MTKSPKTEIDEVKRVELDAAPAISRRSMIAGAAMVGVGAVCMAATANRAQAQGKQKPTDVGYQDSPQGENKCEKCALFQPPDACQAVEGKVSPNGWCQMFSPKA